MAHINLAGDESQIVVVHNAVIDKIIIRIGYDGALTLKDRDEANALVAQLQDAIHQQIRHEGRELARDEEAVRGAAAIREEL